MHSEHSVQSATVLRNVRIEPGELGAVWVTGSEDASVVLDTVVDQVIEGVAVREKFVIVPVYNDTKEEMKFEKHQSIGSWKLVDGSVNGVSSEGGEESPRCRRVDAQGEDEWEAIMEKLIKNRGEAIGRELEIVLKECSEVFAKRNKEEVAVEKREGKENWKRMQEEEEWVVELVRKWREVENGKGEKTEIVKIPDSTKKYSMADVIVEEGILYLIGRDHERRLYVPRRERLRLVKEIHESVLVGHVGVQKLLERVEKEYVWGSMNKDVAKVVRECERRILGGSDEWEDALPYALYAYNTVPHKATGESPTFLFHGRDDRLPTGESWRVDERYVVDSDDYKSSMMLRMKRTKEIVNERLQGEREKMKIEYDRREKGTK
ncbi:hypothetical protein PFISCL1PPCAC_24693 [Pristionchus fissidentatus]|uniref:RNA-directed DNA polymerase n=1 Tax=Pristionchus fissidentatus TaxID=1538716 RepID=A0AAV5WQV2_9BILA|nr:hypothetical protein PFISCL1PPCAC_24693 [Pristionchus fissidentatus]